jgi:hypothetical protein
LLADEIKYDGSQLASHWIYTRAGVMGDAAVAFIGPCDVSLTEMADLKDKLAGDSIRSDRMAHFLVELFGRDMEASVLYQRALITVIKEVLNTLRAADTNRVRRAGDDLYLETERGRGKVSVSIATVSPVSAVIHAAVNVSEAGAPVAAAGLTDLGVDEQQFAQKVLEAYEAEIEGIDEARVKTRAVR